ncbi:hypothetical protein CERSUDRAFT_99125 [Gelatoporia subvermispora B]|uniref:Uncharacterized protein n=1 Tax=Ceriporiopsis subvermispora (strain B) TaxID=914234 RepID=M2PB19_CERS8|nr:hypothetical protein CERSUDRAFT_99125 [Gelatoporia subvermispora B]
MEAKRSSSRGRSARRQCFWTLNWFSSECTFAMKESDPSPAAGNIAYESMRLLERLSKLSPVPGLDVILGVVNNIAKDLKLVHKNQQEYIRLSRRCVEVMCIVHQEALQSGVEGLDEHIERFIGVFGTVYIFLRSRGHRHRGKFGQWLYRDDISQQLDECRQMLDNALKDWMLVLSLRTFTRVNRPRRGQTQMFPEDFAFEQPQGAANRDLDAPPSLSDALLDPGVSMTVDTAPIIPLNAATSASPLPPPPPAHRVVNEETAQNAFKELGIDVVDSSDRNKMDRDRPKPTVDTNERPLGDAWRLNILGVEYTDRHAVVLVAFVAVGLLVVGRTRY